jgi:hypothetical protein
MLLFDSEGIDAIFYNVEQLIGMSIEKMVIESKARATFAYISHLLRGSRGTLARLVGIERVVGKVVRQGTVMGYGDIGEVEVNWKERYMTVEIGNPYSLSLFCGDFKGASEAIRKVEATVSSSEIKPGYSLVSVWNEPHAPGLEGRLLAKQPARKPGDIEYERCPECKVPVQLKRYH